MCFFAIQLSAHIIFEGGVFACLEYLEAVPGLDSSNSEDVLVRLLHAVTKGKKAHLSLPSQMPTLGSGDRKDYMI